MLDEVATSERLDPRSAECVVGALVAEAERRGYVSTWMSTARFRSGLRAFAATLFDANQLVGRLSHGGYRSYGPVFDHPGVASLVDGSTVLELCELAVRVERARVEVVRVERPSVLHGFVRRAFAVQVQAGLLRSRRTARPVCRRPRPRQYRPRRARRVARTCGPRGDPHLGDDDDPHEVAVALEGVAA